MAICKFCEREMKEADGCIAVPMRTVDGEIAPLPYGKETRNAPPFPGQMQHGIAIDESMRCHDCCTLPGHFHHVGCDWEECPRCHDQAISCECILGDEEENEELQETK
jgi:hypothetical protein